MKALAVDWKIYFLRFIKNIKAKILAEFNHAPVGTAVAVLVSIDLFTKFFVEHSEVIGSIRRGQTEITSSDVFISGDYFTIIEVYTVQIGISIAWSRLYLIYRSLNTGLVVFLLFISSITAAFITMYNSVYYAVQYVESNEYVGIGIYVLPLYATFVLMSGYLILEEDVINKSSFPWVRNLAYMALSWMIFHGVVASMQERFQHYFNDRYTHAITGK